MLRFFSMSSIRNKLNNIDYPIFKRLIYVPFFLMINLFHINSFVFFFILINDCFVEINVISYSIKRTQYQFSEYQC